MKSNFFLLPLFLMVIINMQGQEIKIEAPKYIASNIENSLKNSILDSLNKLTSETNFDRLTKLLNPVDKEITIDLLKQLNTVVEQSKETKKQLINAYEIENDKYLFQLAYYIPNKNNGLTLTALASFLVFVEKDQTVSFSSPISYHTKHWNRKTIGNIKYYYKNSFSDKIAEEFNENNKKISKKLDLTTEELFFYKCFNYQEVLKLIGLDYLMSSNGEVQSSTIIENTIITGLNTEDFSHDIFHFYSSKLFERKVRNWTTEEGLAYSWGNAYYTNSQGEVISRKELIDSLKIYLEENKDSNLFQMFVENPPIFKNISPKVSLKSTISSILCDEVEKQKGIKGIKELISCGRSLNDYFTKIGDLINVDNTNFDSKIRRLLIDY